MELSTAVLPTLLSLLLINTTATYSLTPPSTPTKPPTSSAPSPAATPAPTSSPKSPSSRASSSSSSTLDPKQLTALQSLNLPTSKDPCSNPPALHNATHCDNSKPFRHLLSLSLVNCSDDVSLSITALKSLSTLRDLQFINCPIAPVRFPSELIANLHSFTCINSLRKLTGVWLSRLQNLTDLTVSGVTVNASGPSIILGSLRKLKSVTIAHTNLTGYLPKLWHPNITYIDLSGNQLKAIPSLVHLDLSSNQLNGSIPKFLADMKDLKYLNLEKNNFQGVMPFNASFIKSLTVFKIGENSNLCYNHSTISPKVKLGIAPCDKNGFPTSPPAKSDTSSSSSSDESDYNDGSGDGTSQKHGGHHGPNKVVLGVAIALSSIIFLIIFLILLSKWCA
ncbi:hypothetical protein Ancab_005441 [Ancistrocladus abbreviatus]